MSRARFHRFAATSATASVADAAWRGATPEAVRLDPSNAGGHATLARAYWFGKGMLDEGITERVRTDLTGPDGQFYSAEDADSARDPSKPHDKTEGAFYVWRAAEIDQFLGPEVAPLDMSLERNFYTTSSCGLCGKASLDAVRTTARWSVADDPLTISPDLLALLPQRVRIASMPPG